MTELLFCICSIQSQEAVSVDLSLLNITLNINRITGKGDQPPFTKSGFGGLILASRYEPNKTTLLLI